MAVRCFRPAALCGAVFLLFTSARAAEPDALAITAEIQARHLPFQTIVDPVYASATSSQIVGYTRCGDSALWTGHYLAAEAFRYKVTGAADALANVNSAIAGISGLVDVTGTGLLARCRVLANSPYEAGIASEEAANGIYQSPPYVWVGNTSRDEYVGVIFGLGVAYDMVNDSIVQAAISQLVTRLVDFLQNNAWNIVTPSGINPTFLVRPDHVLGILQVAQHVNPSHFASSYSNKRSLLALTVPIPIGVDTANDDSYFKFNLDSITFYNLIRLESGRSSNVYNAAYDILRAHTARQQNAFFDIIDRALRGPNAARDAETITLLDQWLQWPHRDNYVDLTNTDAVCGGQACDPVPVPLRPPTDFLWQRSPYQLTGGGTGTIENAGIDYILPYWMARYYGVLSSAYVQSSASASVSAVSPNSIATIFGSNLASTTTQAAMQPPPTTLGGVTVTVKDAAGQQRPALLMYVSAAQINFVVPDGTSTGEASLTVTNGGTTTTVMGMIQNVAPSLFSMNGQGTGIAAATAIQISANNPNMQAPIPVFTCSEWFCSATPLDLGVDTPIVLSLYGTGIRNRSSLLNVTVTINGTSVPVQYAASQPSFAGLDQVNVLLTLNLRGGGVIPVVLGVDGQTSNTVTIDVQ